jgi:crotonobetainyl-CoA:carnitine CoA-transferase CaiB-like acyl-CoA transferase
MAALLHRARTGEGQCIDAAQIETGASLFGPYYLDYTINGRNPAPSGNRRPGAAPYGAYPCSDGRERWCAIEVTTQEQWERFCSAIGNPSWCQDPRFATPLARDRNRGALDVLVGDWTRGHTGQEVMTCLQAAGVAAAAIQDVEDQFFRDPHAQARGLLVELQEPEAGPVVTEYPPVRLSETPPRVDTPAPLLGEHTNQVLRDVLHLSEAQIAELGAEGVLE